MIMKRDIDDLKRELQRSMEAIADNKIENEGLKGDNDRLKGQVDALLQRARSEVPNSQTVEDTERKRWEPRCPQQTVSFLPPPLFAVRDPRQMPAAQFLAQP